MQRFRGGLVFKAHRLCASLNSRRERNKEEETWMRKMRSVGAGELRRHFSKCNEGCSSILFNYQLWSLCTRMGHVAANIGVIG